MLGLPQFELLCYDVFVNEMYALVVIAVAIPVFVGLWIWRQRSSKHDQHYKKNLRRVARLRERGERTDRFESDKGASLELFNNGRAIYQYVYGINGEFKEWECTYEIRDGELSLQPYFNTKLR